MKSTFSIFLCGLCLVTGLASSNAEAQTSGRYCRDRNGKVYHRSSTPCPRGETEVSGPNGGGGGGTPAATDRDSFAGGTGTANLTTGVVYAVDEVNESAAPGTLFAGTLNSCTQVEFRFDVQVAPGSGNTRSFLVRSDSNAGARGSAAACSVTGTTTSCTGTASLAYSPGDSIAVAELETGSPVAAPARWAVRCTAH